MLLEPASAATESDAEADGCDRRAARVEECETNLDKWQVATTLELSECRQTKGRVAGECTM